jgi:hypothetical protein
VGEVIAVMELSTPVSDCQFHVVAANRWQKLAFALMRLRRPEPAALAYQRGLMREFHRRMLSSLWVSGAEPEVVLAPAVDPNDDL